MFRERIAIAIGCMVLLSLYLSCAVGDVWIKHSGSIPQNSTIKNHLIKHYGIWKVCYEDNTCRGINAMHAMKILPKWVQVVRIFAVTATLQPAIGIAIAIVGICYKKAKLTTATYPLLLGPFFMMIALSVYTKFEDPKLNYIWAWGYILGWLGTCIAPICGILILISIVVSEN